MELLIICLVIGLIPAAIAHSKGHNFFLWWIFGALLWIVAMPCAIVISDRRRQEREDATLAALAAVANRAAPPPPQPELPPAHGQTFSRESYPNGYKLHFERSGHGPEWRCLTPMHQQLVGERFYDEAIRAMEAGTAQSCELVREPDNPHDSNAIAAHGIWHDASGATRRRTIGHLPRELAADIAALRPADMPLRAELVSIYRTDEVLDVKVEILEPSARSQFWAARGGAPSAFHRVY